MKNDKKNLRRNVPNDLHNALADENDTERSELVAVWSLLEKAGATFEPLQTRRADQEDLSTDLSWSAVASLLSISSTHSETTTTAPAPQAVGTKVKLPTGAFPGIGMRAVDLPARARQKPAIADRLPKLALLRTGVHRWSAIAASIALLVVAYQWFVPLTINALPGEQASYVLPDGSTVELNSDSELAYARPMRAAFAATRRVQLRGEAFFEVTKMDKPFVVAAQNASVKVVGTQFNVQSRLVAGVPRTAVAVVEGHVLLSSMAGSTVDLTAGLYGVVDAQDAPTLAVASPTRIAGWKQGTLALIDLPFGDLLVELERRFGQTVEVSSAVNLSNRKTAYYSADRSLESILADLCFSEKLAFKPTATGFRIELP